MFVVSFVHCKSSLGMRVKGSKNDGTDYWRRKLNMVSRLKLKLHRESKKQD